MRAKNVVHAEEKEKRHVFVEIVGAQNLEIGPYLCLEGAENLCEKTWETARPQGGAEAAIP